MRNLTKRPVFAGISRCPWRQSRGALPAEILADTRRYLWVGPKRGVRRPKRKRARRTDGERRTRTADTSRRAHRYAGRGHPGTVHLTPIDSSARTAFKNRHRVTSLIESGA